MRGQNRFGLSVIALAIAGAGSLVVVAGAFSAENAPEIVPRVTGGSQPMEEIPAPALARPITDDKRVMRNYPEQPPVIPHSIDNYQLTLKTNRCLDCHRRQYTEGSGAPARMKANDSLECRNCHSAIAMDFTKQTRRAADIHGRFLIPGERTCIDCHKGIAHELPDMTGIEPGWREPPELRGKESSWRGERETLRQYLAELQIFEEHAD